MDTKSLPGVQNPPIIAPLNYPHVPTRENRRYYPTVVVQVAAVLVALDDGSDGCSPFSEDLGLSGKIVFIPRGGCLFAEKVQLFGVNCECCPSHKRLFNPLSCMVLFI